MLLLSTLAGCATLNESECRNADWQTIGLEDGSSGLPLNTISRHRKACAEYGVKTNLDAYRRGHADGVVIYCTPRNGFVQGRAGRSHHDVCPGGLRNGFIAGYEDGRELHLLDQDRKRVRRNIDSASESLAQAEDRLAQREARVVADGVSSAERENLLVEIKTDLASIRRLLSQRDQLESELQRMDEVYDTLSAQYRY